MSAPVGVKVKVVGADSAHDPATTGRMVGCTTAFMGLLNVMEIGLPPWKWVPEAGLVAVTTKVGLISLTDALAARPRLMSANDPAATAPTATITVATRPTRRTRRSSRD